MVKSKTCVIPYQIKPSLWMYVLHNLHRHDVDFHCFLAFLHSLRLSSCFISRGKISYVHMGFENLSAFLIGKAVHL